MFAISLIAFSIWSRISDDLVTVLAWEIIEDHSKSEGRCFGGLTPSFSDASELFLRRYGYWNVISLRVKICFSDEQT